MSKKRKKRSSFPRAGGYSNHHHLLWQRRKWDRGDLRVLRSHPYCIVEISANTLHRKIHENMRQIPPPRPESAKNVLWHLQYLEKHGGIKPDDPIEKRLKVLIALFDCNEQPTADALRKQLEIVCESKKAP